MVNRRERSEKSVTGRAEGKLELKRAKVFLASKQENVRLKDAIVFIHVKGYSLARVTHLDVEHDLLDNIIPPKTGYFLTLRGVENGIKIELGKPKEVEYENKKLLVESIFVHHTYFKDFLKNGTRAWVGGKFGGIYIGFKKEQIIKLEAIAREKFHFKGL